MMYLYLVHYSNPYCCTRLDVINKNEKITHTYFIIRENNNNNSSADLHNNNFPLYLHLRFCIST